MQVPTSLQIPSWVLSAFVAARFCQQAVCLWTKFLLRINFSAATCQSSWSFAALRPLSKYFTVRLASSWEAIVADFCNEGEAWSGQKWCSSCDVLYMIVTSYNYIQLQYHLIKQVLTCNKCWINNSASTEIQDLSAMGQDAEVDQRVSCSPRIFITSRTSHLASAIGNAHVMMASKEFHYSVSMASIGSSNSTTMID